MTSLPYSICGFINPHLSVTLPSDISINLFSIYIANKQYEKAFQFYGLNAEYIPIDNLSVYSNFKELIKNVTSTEAAKILSSKVASEISKQEVYNKRIDSLLNETCAFTKKVYQAIENEPFSTACFQMLSSLHPREA